MTGNAMRSKLFRLLLTMGLGTATFAGTVSQASADDNVRDHRKGGRDHGRGHDKDRDRDRGPREAPPPPRAERQAARRGYVWVAGNWDWNNGRWNWVAGHYERERAGRKWRDARWEMKGDVYVRVDGDWIEYDDRPRQAPPATREERIESRRGYTFVKGYWDWRGGNYEWVPGRWEREKAGKRWRDYRWENKDGVYVRVDGDWETYTAPAYPTAAPPAPRDDRRDPNRAGYVWVAGFWDWKNGAWDWTAGHWERERAGKRWRDFRWEQRDGRWQRIDGDWEVYNPPSPYPTSAPPANRDDRQGPPRDGYAWAVGRWEWKDGKWANWLPGHWERIPAGKRWSDGRWMQRDGKWEYVEGWWKDNGPAPVTTPPPPPPVTAPIQPTTPPPPPPPAASGPTSPPPAPRDERVEPRTGYVFARGQYEWRNGAYEWVPGHWERAKARMTWQDARWEQRGNVWVFIQGGWR